MPLIASVCVIKGIFFFVAFDFVLQRKVSVSQVFALHFYLPPSPHPPPSSFSGFVRCTNWVVQPCRHTRMRCTNANKKQALGDETAVGRDAHNCAEVKYSKEREGAPVALVRRPKTCHSPACSWFLHGYFSFQVVDGNTRGQLWIRGHFQGPPKGSCSFS